MSGHVEEASDKLDRLSINPAKHKKETPGNELNSAVPPCPLFALIIGINSYGHGDFLDLSGAEGDAELFRGYLIEKLHVPESRIVLLLSGRATRAGITEAFQNLANDERIAEGDPIVIFYAGHGTEINKKLGGETQKIQMLVPVDSMGILDHEVGVLIDHIAEKKGDNITVIFDCCNAASGTRGRTDNRESKPRTRALPPELVSYADISRNSNEGTRGIKEFKPQFRHKGVRSHMLLAACSSSEEAKEVDGHGIFTTALLKLFRVVSPYMLKYSDILLQIDRLSGQNPQCEGVNQERFLFNGKVAPKSRESFEAEIQQPGQISSSTRLEIYAGSAHGITERAQFNIHARDDTSFEKVLGKAVVVGLKAFSASAEVVERSTAFNQTERYAVVQTRAGDKEDFRLYIPPRDKFRGIFNELLDNESYGLYNITTKVELKDAHIQASMGNNDDVTFEVVDLHATQHHGFSRRFDHVQTKDPARLAWVLNRLAHYYRELNRTNPDDKLASKVKLDFYRLNPGPSGDGGDWREYASDGINLYENGIIDFVVDEAQPYGLKLTNLSHDDLYPYVFYFDNSHYSIDHYYMCPPDTGNGFKRDAPLKAGQFITLGHGSSGVEPFGYTLEENQHVDVGFLKVFLFTKAIDLSNILQNSPFETNRASTKFIRKQVDKWDAFLIPMVQRRQN